MIRLEKIDGQTKKGSDKDWMYFAELLVPHLQKADWGNLAFGEKDITVDAQMDYFYKMIREKSTLFLVYEDDRLIGTVGLHEQQAEPIPSARLGSFIFCFNDRHKGYASQALSMLINKAFTQTGLERLYVNILSSNEKGIKQYTDLGFRNEGLMERCYKLRGQYLDMYHFALLKEDWQVKFQCDWAV